MKARIPAIRKVSKKAVNDMREVANTQVRHAAYRMYLVACLTLSETFGFGEVRLARFIDALTRNLDEYGERVDGNMADHKLFKQVDQVKGILIEEKVREEMLEYEGKRFRDSMMGM